MLVLAALLAGAGCAREPAPRVPPRSAVIFLVDTLRADHLGCYGYERDTTPALDAFAAEGLLFEQCLAQSTWTKPASASVLTGRYAAVHGMLAEESVLPADVTTLAERLHAGGLATGAFVTNQQVARKQADLLRGFDDPHPLYDPGGDPPYVRAGPVVDEVLAWIEARGEEPFFCYVHTVDPHAPYQPPPPFDERFVDPGASEVDGTFVLHASPAQYAALAPADVQRLIDLYDGEIAYTDHEFGRFLAGLEALGRDRDTLVIFVADHGEAFDEHGSWGHNPFMHREVVRVPLLMRFPPGSGFPNGRREELCAQVDLAPTLLDVLGLPASPELPGRSLVAPLDGPVPPRFSEVEGGVSRKAVVAAGRKYIRQWSPVASEQLFDLGADPLETEDLAGTDVVAPYRELMDTFVAGSTHGYSLLVQNGADDWLSVDCRLEASAPFDEIKLFYAEDKARHGQQRDGPPEIHVEEDGSTVVACRFHVAAGDGDGLRFDPGPDVTAVRIDVSVDGHPVAPELVRIGAAGSPPASVPWTLELPGSSELEAPRPPARTELGEEPYRVSLWRPLSVETDSAELSEDEQAALRALGYLGED